MTLTDMANVMDYLHREARKTLGPAYDHLPVNREVQSRCHEHGLDYDRVVARLVTTRYANLIAQYQTPLSEAA